MVARLLLLLALLLPAPAAADTLEGSWALQMGGAAIFRFDLAKDADGKWHGTWSKPSSFASNGNSFSHLKGPPKKVPSMTALETPDGIELSFNDPRPGAVPDIFDFKPIDSDAVELVYVGTDLAPYTLDRVKAEAPLGPWDAAATYSREAPPKEPAVAPDRPAEDPPAIEPGTFRLKPGAPVGR
uniref:hypothetical protein n=1 Tax=Altererythrobacter segetis TaxID=1104773 RepID=UPI00140C5CB9|nr:hypothetical protein [Altererythrobacter segetis]